MAPEPLTAVSNPPVEALELATFGRPTSIRRSATSTCRRPTRQLTEVAKLIDVSKCIGCKACQSACIEWNDTYPRRSRYNIGVYDNPHDLTPEMFTLMRFTEWENPETEQSRVADPQGRLHALRGSGLPQGLPGARRDRAVLERHRRLRPRELHRLRLLRQGLPVQHPAHLARSTTSAYKCTLCSDRVAVGRGAGLRQGLPDPVRSSSAPRRSMIAARRRAHRRPEVARLRQCRPLRPAGRRRHARDVRAAPRRQAARSTPACRPIRRSRRSSRPGRA